MSEVDKKAGKCPCPCCPIRGAECELVRMVRNNRKILLAMSGMEDSE